MRRSFANRSPSTRSHARNAATWACATFGPERGSRSSVRAASLVTKAWPAAWLDSLGAKKSFTNTW